jgi:hypothetical protein
MPSSGAGLVLDAQVDPRACERDRAVDGGWVREGLDGEGVLATHRRPRLSRESARDGIPLDARPASLAA